MLDALKVSIVSRVAFGEKYDSVYNICSCNHQHISW